MPLYSPAQVKALLLDDIEFLRRAILLLHKHQTTDEQDVKISKHLNAKGFSAADALYLSEVAECIKNDGPFKAVHLEAARERMMKYSKQLSGYIDESFWVVTTRS